MRRVHYHLTLVICLSLVFVILIQKGHRTEDVQETSQNEELNKPLKQKNMAPADWFVRQRAFPEESINVAAYRQAVRQAQHMREEVPPSDEAVWTEAGPDNIGGRITALGIHPDLPSTIYAGTAAGGVLKSVDGGVSWTPIFDETGVLSIGAVAVDPSNASTIWVGTGEANAPGDTYVGDGVYLSTDGGENWGHMGLDDSYQIGRIAIDPVNPQKVFVAACGALFGTNPDRGLYRTENGGISWEQVLYLTDSTAAVDVAINPQNPDIVYACMWERIRHPGNSLMGGETSGIWRSSDGGDTWMELTNGLPAGPDVGRIGITIFPQNPDILYAIYADHPGYLMGVWRTTDGGDSWVQTGSPSILLYLSYGWFFGRIVVDPVDPLTVYVLGVPLMRTTNGGDSWFSIGGAMHVDHHDLWIQPDLPTHIYDGNDGGVFYTSTGGAPWIKSYDLHISQFYAIEIDYLRPFRLYGGTQDNGTLRTWTGALDDWDLIYGGDGFYTLVDYTNSNIIFAESQYGELGKSTNGGYFFLNATNGIESSDRRNWSTPVVMDPVDPQVMYYGTHRLYKTTNQANLWFTISDDLTNGQTGSSTSFNTITTIAVAPTNTQVIYVGTDDGNVWVTQNGGEDWTSINAGLPERWITRTAVSPQDEATVYVTLSGYRMANEYLPHVYRSTNYGADWSDISGNLPEAPVNCILEDPENPQRLVVATDLAVYHSGNLGFDWQLLGTEIPLVPVHDLKLHNPTRDLIAGTHGRSMYRTNLDSLSTGLDVTIALTPESTTIQIPTSGGDFDYTIEVSNNEAVAADFDVWIDVTLPNGTVYGPLLGPVALTLPAGGSVARDRTQSVPENAPSGNYTYNAYVGDYPTVWNSDSFPFSKLQAGYGPVVNRWDNSGESLGEDVNFVESGAAAEFFLLGAHPNPFNPTTSISFQLSALSHVSLKVYDVSGRQVAQLVNGWQGAGMHEVMFDATGLPSGVYIYTIQTNDYSTSGKMVLMK